MLPTRVPVPLPGSSVGGTAGSDVRPIAQWVEPARSGAGMAVTLLSLVSPDFYFGTAIATGTLSSVWLRREGGPVTDVITGAVNVNLVYVGSVEIASGQEEAEATFGLALSPGDDVRVFMFGGNQSVASGVLRTPGRIFRLLPAALGRVYIMVDGEWTAPPVPNVITAGTWEDPDSTHVLHGTWQTPLS